MNKLHNICSFEQVFNILDEEHRTRSRSDSSPRVLDIWKKTPDTPNSTESPKCLDDLLLESLFDFGISPK